jgi:hypothetical protein
MDFMLIDDSLIGRKYARKVLFPKNLGMPDWIILGENQTQLDLCVSFANAMNPNIAIMDKNLELLVGNHHNPANKESPTSAAYLTGTPICEDLVKAKVGRYCAYDLGMHPQMTFKSTSGPGPAV